MTDEDGTYRELPVILHYIGGPYDGNTAPFEYGELKSITHFEIVRTRMVGTSFAGFSRKQRGIYYRIEDIALWGGWEDLRTGRWPYRWD